MPSTISARTQIHLSKSVIFSGAPFACSRNERIFIAPLRLWEVIWLAAAMTPMTSAILVDLLEGKRSKVLGCWWNRDRANAVESVMRLPESRVRLCDAACPADFLLVRSSTKMAGPGRVRMLVMQVTVNRLACRKPWLRRHEILVCAEVQLFEQWPCYDHYSIPLAATKAGQLACSSALGCLEKPLNSARRLRIIINRLTTIPIGLINLHRSHAY